MLVMLSFNFIGDVLRDLPDPRSRIEAGMWVEQILCRPYSMSAMARYANCAGPATIAACSILGNRKQLVTG
jgi:hypothetical protein